MQHQEFVDPASAGVLAAIQATEIGLGQQEIADVLAINQSQISRIFSGKIRRNTDTLMRVCKFVADRSLSIHPDDVRRNDVLIGAIAEVWDGTERDAQVLASIIRSLRALRRSNNR